MHWAAVGYAWWLILAGATATLMLRHHRFNHRDLVHLAPSTVTPQTSKGYAAALLPLLVPVLLIAALCRPQWGDEALRQENRGLDILVVLDVSRSMLANDVQPSRLAAARHAITELLPRLQGDRVGLIAFAGSAFQVCPLTSDYGTFSTVLAATAPETIPMGGTNLAAALREAARAFAVSGDRHKVLVLLSDGEDHGSDAVAAARALRDVTVLVLAVGTRQGGLIPAGSNEFLKDRQGRVVSSRMDADGLSGIAEAAAGRILDLTPEVLSQLYSQDLAHMERRPLLGQDRSKAAERFQIPLVIAVALMLYLGRRRRAS